VKRFLTRSAFASLVFVLAVVVAGRHAMCRQSVRDASTFETTAGRVHAVAVASGLSVPWSLAFLPNADILVTERDGRLRVVRQGRLDPRPILGVPDVQASGHGGLLDIAVHPDFVHNSLVYLTYTKSGERGMTVAVLRGRLEATRLSDVQDILVAEAWGRWDLQFGSRLAFGWDRSLFVSIGDRNERHRAQDLSDHAGTILRLQDDGGVPDDNPFVGRAGFRPEIYSYGHRNVQGLAIHPVTGAVWASEHGPQGGDEVNEVFPGANYGWPLATFGKDYMGEIISPPHHEGTVQPRMLWVPSIGTGGMMFYVGDKFPKWSGNLFVAATSGRQIQRLFFTEAGTLGREDLLAELGQRVRDVQEGPDGLIYAVTDAGLVLRIQPECRVW
jgi:aldose sugar dehydrogenase